MASSVRVDLEGPNTHQVIDGVGRKPKRIEVDPNGWWLLKTTVRSEQVRSKRELLAEKILMRREEVTKFEAWHLSRATAQVCTVLLTSRFLLSLPATPPPPLRGQMEIGRDPYAVFVGGRAK